MTEPMTKEAVELEVTQERDAYLCRMLDALAFDCENTDGWEGAASDLREASLRLAALNSTRTVPQVAEQLGDELKAANGRIWLWRDFIDGLPRYVAYCNPFPCHESGDPLVIGQPCGWAYLMPSIDGRPGYSVDQVQAEITSALRGSVPGRDE